MASETAPQAESNASTAYFDLGTFQRPISTTNPLAQLWFDRGLVWCYGFNRSEGLSCFKKAVAADPDCAIAYWGVAYASGAYYNKTWDFFDEKELRSALDETFEAAQESKRRAHRANPVEQALIDAIQQRHPSAERPKDFSEWDLNYKSAMKAAYETFGDDLDVATLYADAMMVLTPWKMWDPYSGKPAPKACTLEVKAVLERAFRQAGGYDHPGLLHLYVHLMEMSRSPEDALNAADRLRGLIPDAGHLNHMPSHIDVLVGDYRRAIEANEAAIHADNKYLSKFGGVNWYTMYRAHNYHSLIYAAMFAGKSAVALSNCILLEKSLPEELLRIESPSMADFVESYHAVRAHVLVRFGRWRDIIDLELPKDEKLYCFTVASIHYAKGVAWAATGNIDEAEREQNSFRAAAKRVPKSRWHLFNRCENILRIAEAMLVGEINYRKGYVDRSFEHLKEAISLDDSLQYTEPWGWMQPTRHAYAALLLEQRRYDEAAAVYEADLGLNDSQPRGHQHPNNVWALQGYHECLIRLGRTAEARLLELQLKAAVRLADVLVTSSCFCRRDVPEEGDCCSVNKNGKHKVPSNL